MAQVLEPGTLRRVRTSRGVGVRELARRLKVTPGAITFMERSDASGRIRIDTLTKALEALGTSLDAELPKLSISRLERREDRVALELHKAIAKKLIDDPIGTRAVVPGNIERLRERVQGAEMKRVLERWEELSSAQNIGPLIDAMLGDSSLSRTMRQTSPFAGVLNEAERLEAIHKAQL